MKARWRWMTAALVALPGCLPGGTSGPGTGPTPTASLPAATAMPSAGGAIAPAGTPTPLPPVIAGGASAAPSPVATSSYNALFTPGKTWEFAQTVNAGGKEARGRVRVVVVEVAAAEATIAVQEEPFASPGPGEVPGRRTRFALDAENPFEKWGTSAADAPRPTSVDTEAVTVPAGAFPATTRYTYDTIALGYATHRVLWVAAGTGLVKLVSTLRPESDSGPATSTTVWELERKP